MYKFLKQQLFSADGVIETPHRIVTADTPGITLNPPLIAGQPTIQSFEATGGPLTTNYNFRLFNGVKELAYQGLSGQTAAQINDGMFAEWLDEQANSDHVDYWNVPTQPGGAGTACFMQTINNVHDFLPRLAEINQTNEGITWVVTRPEKGNIAINGFIEIYIINTSGGTIAITGQVGDTINGLATYSITTNGMFTLRTEGLGWFVS